MSKKLLLGLVGAGALAATVFHKKENLLFQSILNYSIKKSFQFFE